VDGALINSATFTPSITTPTGTSPFHLATEQSTGSPDYLNGQIDDVRIYNRALNEAEIKYIINGRGMATQIIK